MTHAREGQVEGRPTRERGAVQRGRLLAAADGDKDAAKRLLQAALQAANTGKLKEARKDIRKQIDEL